ncbi:hypothetical protein D7X33_50325 [Butyricicoccus sp. 1XD8-22]|nr:hypothetical protein D7X33_50325 [Butyricicoccus sp. 1XD8-22]
MADIKMQLDYGSSAISQEIVHYWLTSGLYEKHIEQLRDELKRRAYLMENLLERFFAGIASWKSSKGGFYIWLKFNDPIVTTEFFMKSLKYKVLINPGYIYEPKDAYHIRLSYAYASDDQLEQGLLIIYELAIQGIKKFHESDD